jgi:hypothetical protein
LPRPDRPVRLPAAGQQTDGIMMIIRDEVLPAVLDN